MTLRRKPPRPARSGLGITPTAAETPAAPAVAAKPAKPSKSK